ncbi:MAG: 50S ribosomal protein L24 [Desulfobacteraceae bacterium]
MKKQKKVSGNKIRIKKNDIVEVMAGRDRGKTGKVLRILGEKNRLVVEKVNMIKRHTRPSPTTGQGGIVEKEGPIHVSNVQLVCPKCSQPTRLGHSLTSQGEKVRVCKKCGEMLEG